MSHGPAIATLYRSGFAGPNIFASRGTLGPQGDLRRKTLLGGWVNKGLPLYETKVVRDPTASQRGKTQTNAASYVEEGGSVAAERPTG